MGTKGNRAPNTATVKVKGRACSSIRLVLLVRPYLLDIDIVGCHCMYRSYWIIDHPNHLQQVRRQGGPFFDVRYQWTRFGPTDYGTRASTEH